MTLGLTWWPGACFAVWVVGLDHSACISILRSPLLGTLSHTRNQSLVPGALPLLKEKPFQIRIWPNRQTGNISSEVTVLFG